MLKIKDIKHGQIFYSMNGNGEACGGFKAWGNPVLVNGIWTIEGECRANYCYTFSEEDELILYPTEELV